MRKDSEPDSTERVAFHVVGRVLGHEVEHYDRDGRQGAVDGLIRLPHGRRGALEVTSVVTPHARKVAAQLKRESNRWSNPGRWTWYIHVGSPSDYKRAKLIYTKVIEYLESVGVGSIDDLPWWTVEDGDDDDLRWLRDSSTCSMRGSPPSDSSTPPRPHVWVLPQAIAGFVDEELRGCNAALTAAFVIPSVAHRIEKLLQSDWEERHLFLWLDEPSPLPFEVTEALATGEVLPPEAAPLPTGITHLWLAHGYSRRVLLWQEAGWSEHHPYDAPSP